MTGKPLALDVTRWVAEFSTGSYSAAGFGFDAALYSSVLPDVSKALKSSVASQIRSDLMDTSAIKSTLAQIQKSIGSVTSWNALLQTQGSISQSSASSIVEQLQRDLSTLASNQLRDVVQKQLRSLSLFEPPTSLIRASLLQTAFASPGTGPAAAFRQLQDVIDSSPRLADSLGAITDTLASDRGTFGAPISALRSHVKDIASVLEADPQLSDDLAAPLHEAQQAGSVDEWDVIRLGAIIGGYERLRNYRLSVPGLVAALTIGVTRFTVGVGTGEALPMSVYDAASTGATVYLFFAKAHS